MELIRIINKPSLLHLVGGLYYYEIDPASELCMKCRRDWDLKIRACGERALSKVLFTSLGGGEFLGWMLDNEFIKNLSAIYCNPHILFRGRVSLGGIANCYGLEDPEFERQLGKVFRTHPDRSRGTHTLLYNGYRIFFPGGKRQGLGSGQPTHSSVGVDYG